MYDFIMLLVHIGDLQNLSAWLNTTCSIECMIFGDGDF